MKSVRTIQAKAVEKIVQFAAMHGVNSASLYAAVDLDPAEFENPDHRIPFEQFLMLYEAGARLTGDEDFGLHVGERTNEGAFDVVGFVATNSPTIVEAFNRVARYYSIWTDGAEFSVAEKKCSVGYRYVEPQATPPRHCCEMTVAAVVVLTRAFTSADRSPVEIRFPHPAPNNLEEHTRIFRAPMRFSAGCCEVIFDAETFNLPIGSADPALHAILDRHSQELLAKSTREDTIVDQVRNVFRDELKRGTPTIERSAEKCGVSARTLQRRLRELGVTHQELLDELRRDLALRYLRETGMSVSEVAFLLGFSGTSAFHRAFKHWTGMTPQGLRRR